MLKRCGVVGDPAGHSLSPAIHRAGYQQHGLDWDYQAYTISAAGLDTFIGDCQRDDSWRGLSVTAPHKEALLSWGVTDEAAQLVGGGNTLIFDREAKVYNTDVSGFIRAWQAHEMFTPRTAAVIGNGATARSIVVSLAQLGVRELIVKVRDLQRATAVVELAKSLGLSCEVSLVAEPLSGVDVLASTIPAAATAQYATSWAQGARAVFDVIYDPWPTPIAQAAQHLGKPALNGLDLLAGQAVDQFLLMTGYNVTFDDCKSAAVTEISRRANL